MKTRKCVSYEVRLTDSMYVHVYDHDRMREAVEDAVSTLAGQALAQTSLISDDAVATISSMVAEIDRKLTEQINLILHHEDFQKLEGSWRGLHHLDGTNGFRCHKRQSKLYELVGSKSEEGGAYATSAERVFGADGERQSKREWL